MSAEWEGVASEGTDRLEVPGGWLYRCAVTLNSHAGIHSVVMSMAFVPKPIEKSITRAELEEAILGPTLSHAPGPVVDWRGEPEALEPPSHRQCAGCMYQMKPGGRPTWGCSQFGAFQSAEHQEWWDAFVCSGEDEWPECPVRTDAPF